MRDPTLSPAAPAQAERPARAKWLWRTIIALISLLMLVVLALLALRLALRSDFGRSLVEARIEASRPGGQSIAIDGLDGDLLGRFTIARLEVSDAQGKWLGTQDIQAEWSPLSLISGHLAIDTLSIARSEITRQPEWKPGDDAPDTPSGSTGFITRYTLGDIALPEIILAEAVTGQAAQVSLHLNGAHGPQGGQLQARLRPISGEGDKLTADLNWGGDIPLRGEMQLRGPSGGLLARLAQLPPGASLDASLSARGDRDTWLADGAIGIDGETALEVAGKGAQDQFELTATARLGAHPLTRALTGRLGEEINLKASAALPAKPGEQRITARISGDTFRLGAVTGFEDGLSSATELKFTSTEPSRLLALDSAHIRAVSLEGTLQRADAWQFAGALDIAGLTFDDWSAASLSGPLALELIPELSARLETQLVARSVKAPEAYDSLADGTPKLDLSAAYDLASGMLQLDRVAIETPFAGLTATGKLFADAAGGDMSGTFRLDGPASGLAPLSAQGRWQLQQETDLLRASLDGEISDWPALPEAIASAMSDRAMLGLRVSRSDAGKLVMEQLQVRSGTAHLDGSGEMQPDGRISVDITGALGALQSGALRTGPLAWSAQIDGTRQDLGFLARADTAQLVAASQTASDLTFTTQGRYGAAGLNGRAELAAGIDGQPARVSSDYRADADAGTWALSDLQISWNQLAGGGRVSGRSGDISALAADLQLAGQLPAILPARTIDMRAEINAGAISVLGRLDGLAAGPLQDAAAEISANGTLEQLDYAIDLADGDITLAGIQRDLSLRLQGSASELAGKQPSTELTAQLNLDDHRLETVRPAVLAITPDGLQAELALTGLGGRAGLQWSSGPAARLALSLDKITIASLLALAGQEPLEGQLSGKADLGFLDGGITGQLDFAAIGIQRSNRGNEPVALTVSGSADGRELQLEASLRDSGTLKVDASAALPVARWLAGQSAGFGAVITGSGPIDAIAASFLPVELDAEGEIALELKTGWPFNANALEGFFRFDRGRFEQGDLGIVLSEIEARTTIGDARIRLESFSASDGGNGRISGSGEYGFGAQTNTLQLVASQMQLINRRDITAKASGRLAVAPIETGYAITGDLTVDRAEIDIANLPASGLTTVDVRFVGDPQDASPQQPDAAIVNLDIALDAPGKIFVSGSGLDAELSLDSQITGPLADPRIDGSASIVRGRFDLAGKRFGFEDSTVRFTGDMSQADLAIRARREADGLAAIIAISGTPQRPEVSLSSEPALPEDEVLSRVLFGRSPADLTALETARLAGALAQLAGGGGLDLLGGVENALGLDQLDFGRNAGGQTEVTTGKYIADNVYLEARTGPAGLPKMVLEWQPLDNIEVEADITPSEEQGVSVRWKHDFD